MKKIVSTLAVSLLLLSAVIGQGIEFFHGSWEEALAEAKKQEKPIFVDAFTTWCGPCKMMSRSVFTAEEVGTFFNENFISLKIDMEKPEGLSFQKTYPVSAYPTLYFIGNDGKVIKRVVGAKQAEEFIQVAKSTLGRADNIEDYVKAYEGGDRKPELVYKYVRALNRSGKPNPRIVNDFLRTQKDFDSDFSRKIIFEGTSEADSRAFELLVQHRSAIAPLVGGEEAVKNKIIAACKATAQKGITMQNEDLIKEAKKKIQTHLPDRAQAFAARMDMDMADKQDNAKDYLKAAKAYAKAAASEPVTELRTVAFELKKRSANTPDALDAAIELMKVASEKSDQSIYALSYADLLLSKGKVAEAKAAAEKAVKLSEKEGEDNLIRAKGYLDKLMQP
ncbi:MAG: thioredoxin family protein [Haliscomenobacter sp.]|nr:thioredoxin family protein [Haliscomenobacter sp.]MBK9489234.1 thioredoxin family protein [Haliscomenobacter sp.]